MDLNSLNGYQKMQEQTDKFVEWKEKEIILEEGKKAVLGILMTQEQAISTESLSDKKAENRARNKSEYKNIVKEHANATKEALRAKMYYNNLERYSSMKQTEINLDLKLARRQEG